MFLDRGAAMPNSVLVWIVLTALLGLLALVFGWRWTSRIWSLPCPSLVGWALESPFYARITGTAKTLERIGLLPGQRVLEIGPGPGRLLISAAQKVPPHGEAVGIDVQPGMVARLEERARFEGITNLTAILDDATQPVVQPESFDVVFLVTTLREIPDRPAVLAQCFRALRPQGVLSITEMLPDPHYQSKATVKRLAEQAGFQLHSIRGGMWLCQVLAAGKRRHHLQAVPQDQTVGPVDVVPVELHRLVIGLLRIGKPTSAAQPDGPPILILPAR